MIITIALFNTQTYGQSKDVSSSELDSMCVKTIQAQMFFLQGTTFYVEINETTKRLENIGELNYLIFKTSDELIKESLKLKRKLDVLRITNKIISTDTIDVNIGYLDLRTKRGLFFDHGLRFVKANFILKCGGTNGYTPTGRFVFDDNTEKWQKIENNKK